MISLHIEVQQTQDADFCEDLGGRVGTRAFESLLKSEVLGTKKRWQKGGWDLWDCEEISDENK